MGRVAKVEVSVIVPMKNAGPFICAALKSLLIEKRTALEVVVVDDGSTDDSAGLVQSFDDARIKLVQGPQRGVAACMNRGLAAASGDLLMRCDADDLYVPGRIARQANWLQENPQYGAVCGSYSMISATARLVAEFGTANDAGDLDIEAELRQGLTRTSLCTFAWRQSVLGDDNKFREYFESAEDIDFQLRLGQHCKVRYQTGRAYRYRLHDASITHSQGSSRRVFFEQTAREFQQERLAAGSDALERGCPPSPPANNVDARMSVGEQAQGHHIGRSWWELSEGRRLSACIAGLEAVRVAPFRRAGWISLFKLLARSMTGSMHLR